MKKFFLPLLAIGAALSLTGCKDEPLADGSQDQTMLEDGDFVFFKATVGLPTSGRSSRSQTDSDGDTNSSGPIDEDKTGDDYEIGTSSENDVRSMILVITGENDEFITHIVLTGMNPLVDQTGKNFKFDTSVKIPFSVLETAYDDEDGIFGKNHQGNTNVRLYAFCNFTQNLYNKMSAYEDNSLTTEWRDEYGAVEEKASMAGETPQSTSSIWSPRSFLMSNAKVFNAEFPEKLSDWDQYADKDKPYDLTGNNKYISVERTAARLDYRDGSSGDVQTLQWTDDSKTETELVKADYAYDIRINKNSLIASASAGPEAAADDNTINLFSVKLNRMILVNMSRNFYYLRRVSKDGMMDTASDVEYCGTETPTNYVVDVWHEEKQKGVTAADAETYFNFPLFDANGVNYNRLGGRYGWYISDISDVLGSGKPDNWNGKYDYTVWRYVTENCIPNGKLGKDEMQQVQQSTGIIFKASIIAGADIEAQYDDGGDTYVDPAVKQALLNVSASEDGKGLPALYSFHNMLYGGVKDIVRAALLDGQGGALYYRTGEVLKNWYLIPSYKADADDKTDYAKTFVYFPELPVDKITPKNGDKPVLDTDYYVLSVEVANEILNQKAPTDNSFDYSQGDYKIQGTGDYEAEKQFIALAPKQEITVFVPTKEDEKEWGYYCYYFYWIRHNDNNLSGKMGPMEFSTVRNNVYKLAVTSISEIGHPRTVERDPDPLTPGTPDEEAMNSIKVSVNVLPWVVRENNIEF